MYFIIIITLLFVVLTFVVFNLFLYKIRWEEGGREEGDITRDHWLITSTGKLSAGSRALELSSCPWAGHLTPQSSVRRTRSELRGPALFKRTQTGIMSILLQKTMDKISNLCLGKHKNKWKLGISVVLEYVLYHSQVQYNF